MSEVLKSLFALIWLIIAILYMTGVFEATPNVLAMLVCLAISEIHIIG